MKSKSRTNEVYEMNAMGTMVLVKFTDHEGTVWVCEEDAFGIDRWYREVEPWESLEGHGDKGSTQV